MYLLTENRFFQLFFRLFVYGNSRRIFLLIFLFLFFVPSLGYCQNSFGKFSGSLQTGFSCHIWKSGDDRISEVSLPVVFKYFFSRKFQLYTVASPVFSRLNTGFTYNLNSISDIKLGGKYFFSKNNRFLLSFNINLPFGKNVLNQEERRVAEVMAISALNFITRDAGRGLNIQASISSAAEFGGTIIAYGAGYSFRGGFCPFSEISGVYDPGDSFDLSFGIRRGCFQGEILYIMSFVDSWQSEKYFNPGDRVTFRIRYNINLKNVDIILFAAERVKTKSVTFQGPELYILPERINTGLNQFEVKNIMNFNLLNGNSIYSMLNIKLYSNSEFSSGGASIFGVGTGGNFRISERIRYKGGISYYIGNMFVNTRKSEVNGFEFSGGIEFCF